MVVPQTGHLPLAVGRPFLEVTNCTSFILRVALHLTQYASTSAGAWVGVGSGRAMGFSLMNTINSEAMLP